MNFDAIYNALNSVAYPDHECEKWISENGEYRLRVLYENKPAGFILNPQKPRYEDSFKVEAKLDLENLDESKSSPNTPIHLLRIRKVYAKMMAKEMNN